MNKALPLIPIVLVTLLAGWVGNSLVPSISAQDVVDKSDQTLSSRIAHAQATTYTYFFPLVSVNLPCPTSPLPPIAWDPRLGPGGLPHLENVRIISTIVAPSQRFWRVVSAQFEDIDQSGGDHTIYVKVLDENCGRVTGQTLQVFSDTSGEVFPDQPLEQPAGDPCNCNFMYPMFGDGYDVRIVGGLASDIMAGMIMPMRRHVNYRITFKRTTNPP